MKQKLTKKELLKQLKEIELEEIKEKDDLLYSRFKDVSFLKMWKTTIKWKIVFLLCLIPIFISFFLEGDLKLFFMFGIPVIIVLMTYSFPYDIWIKIKRMKEEKEK